MNNKIFGDLEKFYFEYNTKYKDELMEELMTVDHDDMHNRISSILNFELKCHDVFEIILQYLNMRSTRNIRKSKLIILVVQQELHFIRLFSECLKNFNQIFFLKKHIDKNGTVKIKTIANELGYNVNDSKKIQRLLFHDIRNALSHMQYEFKYDSENIFKSIIWLDADKKKHNMTLDDLSTTHIEITKLAEMYDQFYKSLYEEYVAHNNSYMVD